jgi:hypothetical protein
MMPKPKLETTRCNDGENPQPEPTGKQSADQPTKEQPNYFSTAA